MNLTKNEILNELHCFYNANHEIFSQSKTDKEIHDFFAVHVKNNLIEISAKELVDSCATDAILMDGPDGPQRVGDFYIKNPRTIIKITTVDGYNAKVSEDHLFETTRGWKKSKDINNNDYLITKGGYNKVKSIEIFNKEEVYDWEILHENHRYWAGNGISSHNTGKTFLALNGCRQAQKEGYHIIYCDSEAAVDAATFRKFGIDPDKVRYQPVNTPLEFKYFVANLIKAMQDAKAAKKQVPKIMLVLDSLGNLATTKERNDAIAKSEKKDMTKQQELRSLFRIITMDLAGAKIPFIMTAHTYACVLGDTNVLMSDGTYKQISEIEKGEYVITLSGNQKVTDVFKYDVDEVIELEFEDGFKISCTPNHKLAVMDNDNNIIYKTVDELQEGDEVIKN